MKKILFIYGYGGSPASTFCKLISERLPRDRFSMICREYPQQDCAASIEVLDRIIREVGVDIVMGTSLGGFITLALAARLPKVVINPGMKPTEILPELKPRPDHPDDKVPAPEMIASYAPFESAVENNLNRAAVYGLFAEADELLHDRFIPMFEAHYGKVRRIRGGHHGNEAGAEDVVKAICEIFS